MIKEFFISLVVFLAVDGVWLMLIARNFYAKYLGYLMTRTPNIVAAGAFYLIYTFGLMTLSISPAVQKQSLVSAVTMGALFGLSAYATYDLTNLATIKDWPFLVTLVDLLWGTFLSGIVAGISYWFLTR